MAFSTKLKEIKTSFSKVALDAESSPLKKDFIKSLKSIKAEMSKIEDASHIVERFPFLLKTIEGFFDGCECLPEEKKYVKEVKDDVLTELELIIEDTLELDSNLKDSDNESKEEVSKSKNVVRGPLKEALSEISKDIVVKPSRVSRYEPKQKELEEYVVTGSHDGEDEAYWAKGSESMKKFLDSNKGKIALVLGLQQVPVLISAYLNKKNSDLLKSRDITFYSAFSLYTFVENMYVYGIDSSLYEQLGDRAFDYVNKLIKAKDNSLDIVCEEVRAYANKIYFIVGPKGVGPFEGWSLCPSSSPKRRPDFKGAKLLLREKKHGRFGTRKKT